MQPKTQLSTNLMPPNLALADPPFTDSMSSTETPKKCTFSEMLDYLVKSRSITETKAEELKKLIQVGVDALNFVKLLVIFTGPEWVTNFISSLPVDNPIFAGDLIAANFEAMCEGTLGWDGIHSIAFDISSTPLRPKLEWAIPFDTTTPDQTYHFVHTSNFRITVEWPTYLMRTTSGKYRGTLAHGGITHHVVGQFTVQDPEGAKYSMEFTDDKYETKDCSLSVSELLNFFNCAAFPFKEQIGWIGAAVVAGLLESLELTSKLTNPSFVLELQSYVSVKEIAGYFSLTIDFKSLKFLPFKLDAKFTELRVALRDIGSPDICTLLLQQYGNIFEPPIPFRLSLGLSAEQPYYEVAIVPEGAKPVSIKKILEAFGLSSTITDKDFPVIGNLSTALAISNASVGWTGKELHYLSLAVEISDWSLANGKFVVQNFLLELRAVAPASEDKHLSFYGSGTIKISDVEIELGWALNHINSETVINFQVATAQRPINVGFILGHFNITESLPEGFVQLLDATNVDGVTLQVVKDASGWSISQFALEMDIRAELDIFSHFKLANPKFAVDVTYPFDSSGKRSFSALINATFVIEEEITCKASLNLSIGKGGLLAMDLEADGTQPVNMGSLFKLFGLNFEGTSIPESVSFLLLIGLTKFNLSLEYTNNKWGMNELSVTAVSSTTLQIWNELKLYGLSLEFHYSKFYQGKTATVKALLSFGTEEDLDVDFTYTGPSTSKPPIPEPTPENVEVSTVGEAAWRADVGYQGKINLLNALSSVTAVDIKDELESVGLKELADVMNIDLSNPRITLARSKVETAFDFSTVITTKTGYFSGKVDLKCSRTTSWMYTFTFGFISENFFKTLGIKNIVLDNAAVKFTNAPSIRNSLVGATAGNQNASVNFSAKLVKNDATKTLNSIVPLESIELTGSITSSSFSIWAKASDLSLFDGSLKLSGEVGALFETSPSWTLQVGLKGEIKDVDLHDISSNKFDVSFGFYIKLPDPQLGLAFESKKTLTDAFTVKGLVIKQLAFSAFFQKFPVPSAVDIKVEEVSYKDTFDGWLKVHYIEKKLTECYASGFFTNDKLEFGKSVGAVYDNKQPPLPKCVDGNFFDLHFWVTWPKRPLKVLQTDGQIIEKDVQGLYLTGHLDLSSIKFSAVFIISVTTQAPIGILVHGSIKNAIVAPSKGNTLFALRDATNKDLGPYLTLMLMQGKIPYFDVSCEVYFLGLTLSTKIKLSQDGFELHENMKFEASNILKTEVKFDIIINKTKFDFKASGSLDIEIKDCVIFGVPIPDLTLVKLDASLSTTIDWSSGLEWKLKITASAEILNYHIANLSFELAVKDLTDLAKQLAVQIPTDLVKMALKNGLEFATRFLKDLGVLAEKASKLLVEGFKQVREEVVKVVGAIYALARAEVERILGILGAAEDEIARVLKHLGLDFVDFIVHLPDDFEKQLKNLMEDIAKVLEEILNLIGGISPRQIKVLKELEKAERTIRSYLGEVEERTDQIKEAMSRITSRTLELQTTHQSILVLSDKARKTTYDALFKEKLVKEEIKYLTIRRKEIETARDKWKADCEEVEQR